MTEHNIPLPRLFDRGLNLLGRVHPAKVSLDLSLTPLSTATMELPRGEKDVQVGMFFELFDLNGSVGFFRVCEAETVCGTVCAQRIRMEHALCTLGDHILHGYAELGGPDMPTAAVISRLLEGQSMWAPGDCGVDCRFVYSFENENLLTALLSLTAPIAQPAMWTCDFSQQPWRLSLLPLPDQPACECRLSRGAQSVNIRIDRSSLCTRLYPRGYGEGADRLTIASVNGGVPYLDADTIGAWGVVESICTEASITDANTLKSAAQSLLDKLKNPVVTVSAEAADLSAMTGESLDRFTLGALCRLPLPDYGLTMAEHIIAIRRPDVYGAPETARLTMASRAANADSELTRLSRKSAVSELYSQGASNQYEVAFADNADPDHPAVMRFYIDEDAVYVNSVKVRWTLERFRGYSKGVASGGAGVAASEQCPISHTCVTGDKNTDSFTDYAAAPNGESHRHMDNHAHSLSLQLDIPPLNVHLPNHSHPLIPGIYETDAPAQTVSAQVDDTAVPESQLTGGSFDAADFLRKDSLGRVQRGAWHTITFTPDAPTRITAGVHVRTFIRSLTGANL